MSSFFPLKYGYRQLPTEPAHHSEASRLSDAVYGAAKRHLGSAAASTPRQFVALCLLEGAAELASECETIAPSVPLYGRYHGWSALNIEASGLLPYTASNPRRGDVVFISCQDTNAKHVGIFAGQSWLGRPILLHIDPSGSGCIQQQRIDSTGYIFSYLPAHSVLQQLRDVGAGRCILNGLRPPLPSCVVDNEAAYDAECWTWPFANTHSPPLSSAQQLSLLVKIRQSVASLVERAESASRDEGLQPIGYTNTSKFVSVFTNENYWSQNLAVAQKKYPELRNEQHVVVGVSGAMLEFVAAGAARTVVLVDGDTRLFKSLALIAAIVLDAYEQTMKRGLTDKLLRRAWFDNVRHMGRDTELGRNLRDRLILAGVPEAWLTPSSVGTTPLEDIFFKKTYDQFRDNDIWASADAFTQTKFMRLVQCFLDQQLHFVAANLVQSDWPERVTQLLKRHAPDRSSQVAAFNLSNVLDYLPTHQWPTVLENVARLNLHRSALLVSTIYYSDTFVAPILFPKPVADWGSFRWGPAIRPLSKVDIHALIAAYEAGDPENDPWLRTHVDFTCNENQQGSWNID